MKEDFKKLDKNCEDWAKKILMPNEFNSARLFAVETRVKENETCRIKEMTFLKETFRKLIFAIE